MARKRIIQLMVAFFVVAWAFGSAHGVSEIRIGVIGPTTGWATIFGQDVLDGVKLALSQKDYKFKGTPIKLFTEDTKADVEVMRTKMDSLKNRDKVHLIIGPSLGHEGMAAVDWAARNPEVPILVGYSAPEDMTMRKATYSLVRPGWTGAQVIFNFGKFCAKDLGYKKIIIVGQDYAYPWDQAAGFIRGFLENGGEKVERIWHPVEAVDFSSIMAKLAGMSKEYDAVLCNIRRGSGGGLFQAVAAIRPGQALSADPGAGQRSHHPHVGGNGRHAARGLLFPPLLRWQPLAGECEVQRELQQSLRALSQRHVRPGIRCRERGLQGDGGD